MTIINVSIVLVWYEEHMHALVLYDSNFGNTKQVAETVAKTIGKYVKAVQISQCDKSELDNLQLLIVGSPINGWKPTGKILEFLDNLKKNQLDGVKAASFDTRVRLFFHGDAAKKIAKKLQAAGAEIVVKPGAFFVNDTEGPLDAGELERAAEWAQTIKRLSE